MDSRNLDHINYSYTDSERAKRNALKKRRRKQLLIQRCVFFLIALLFLILLGKTVFSIKEKLFPKITSSEGNNTSANKAKKKIEFTPIPSDTASLPSDVVTNLNNMAASDKRVAEIVNHYDQYPADLLELLSKNTEATDFVLNYPSEKDKPCADTIGDVTKGGIPHLLQWDTRWGYGIYGDNFLAINGCGPTSLAMVVSGLTGDNTITPYKIAQYAASNGLYVPESGSSWELMRIGAKQYGITSQELVLDESVMANQLASGHPIICSMRPGDFTTTGHFIVLNGYENGQFHVLDPNSNANSEKLWSYERLSPQINNLWAFSI